MFIRITEVDLEYKICFFEVHKMPEEGSEEKLAQARQKVSEELSKIPEEEINNFSFFDKTNEINYKYSEFLMLAKILIDLEKNVEEKEQARK